MKKLHSVQDLYTEFIKDIYHAEVMLIPELQFFVSNCEAPQLKRTLQRQLTTTRTHVSQLEDILETLDADLLDEHCRTMKSMIIESKELVERCDNGMLTERAIVGSLHRITHCLVTVYQMLISMADELNFADQKQILEENLEQEILFDKQISAYGFNIIFNAFNLQQKLT